MDPYRPPSPTDIPIAMRPFPGAITPWSANGIMILSTILLCIIGGITIGAILYPTVPPNLLGGTHTTTLTPMAIAITKTLWSTIVLGAILGTVIAGIVIWRREEGYDGCTCGHIHKCHKRFGNPPDDHEDLEANRGSSSSSSRVHVHPHHNYDHHDPYYSAAYENAHGSDVYDSDSSDESFIYDPEPRYFSGLYRQYPLHEAHAYMHNTSRGDRSSNSDGPVSHQGLERAPSDHSFDSDPYTSDLYDDGYEADSDSSFSSPPTPSDRAPLLQTTRRGPRYS